MLLLEEIDCTKGADDKRVDNIELDGDRSTSTCFRLGDTHRER